ncbi:hypothetical protein AAAZ41_11535 [Bacteroides finegoldii]|uniref:hypothetical protein n=1 Tax=Bacteroides finegoldii TaxID=338188 RepID=UPI0032C095A6
MIGKEWYFRAWTDTIGEVRARPPASFQAHCKFNSNSYSDSHALMSGCSRQHFPASQRGIAQRKGSEKHPSSGKERSRKHTEET